MSPFGINRFVAFPWDPIIASQTPTPVLVVPNPINVTVRACTAAPELTHICPGFRNLIFEGFGVAKRQVFVTAIEVIVLGPAVASQTWRVDIQ
jgi:hypothetical protein